MKLNNPHIWLRPVLLFLFSCLSIPNMGVTPGDSVSISLLTCSPHNEVYALYGHTALRLNDHTTGEDLAINYGVFSFDQPNFITRFIFGLTDYQMGVYPFEVFRREYAYEGRTVIEQTLLLTPEEKSRIVTALIENSRPENMVYRYNFFYDNCTTRARDMVLSHLDGTVRYASSEDSTATFRSMTHDYTMSHLWARFGNDMLLGFQADLPTNRSERQFLPGNLEADFADAQVSRSDGSLRPLVERTTTVLEGGEPQDDYTFPLRPRTCFWLFFALTVIITLIERVTRRLWVFDLLLLVICGLAGLVLTPMLFSQHPTVRLNLQMLILNPLPLLLVYPVIRKSLRGGHHWWWTVWGVLCILFLFCSPFQDYAEGMCALALSLLLRCVSNSRFLPLSPIHKETKAAK